VVERVYEVVPAFFVSHEFKSPVGDDLIGVHVGGSAGSSLDHIDHKLIVELPRDDFIAGLGNILHHIGPQDTKLHIGKSGSFLDVGKSLDQFGHAGNRYPGDLKIPDGTQGLNAVIAVGRDPHFSKEIMLKSGTRHHIHLLICSPPLRREQPSRWCAPVMRRGIPPR